MIMQCVMNVIVIETNINEYKPIKNDTYIKNDIHNIKSFLGRNIKNKNELH